MDFQSPAPLVIVGFDEVSHGRRDGGRRQASLLPPCLDLEKCESCGSHRKIQETGVVFRVVATERRVVAAVAVVSMHQPIFPLIKLTTPLLLPIALLTLLLLGRDGGVDCFAGRHAGGCRISQESVERLTQGNQSEGALSSGYVHFPRYPKILRAPFGCICIKNVSRRQETA